VIGEGEIREGWWEGIILCLSLTLKKIRFTVDYKKSCTMHFREFSPTLGSAGISAGFSPYIINIVGRISEAAIGGAGGAQHPVLPFNEASRTRDKNPLVLYNCKKVEDIVA
jgi:hypothetical protein